ncbi:hypothetical protein J6590_016446 [Homalodisca vitripennis]|nr:hypothetical protein J6590_016446 [Homalodisca vitripennis]
MRLHKINTFPTPRRDTVSTSQHSSSAASLRSGPGDIFTMKSSLYSPINNSRIISFKPLSLVYGLLALKDGRGSSHCYEAMPIINTASDDNSAIYN